MITPQQLDALLPLANAWAAEVEAGVLRDGVALTPNQMKDARALGVAHPERVRLRQVDSVPRPQHPALSEARWLLGLLSTSSVALTTGYGISVRSECWGVRPLICHELVHVSQCERLGGIAGFLRQYLHECAEHGYPAGPLEQEAIALARRHCPAGE